MFCENSKLLMFCFHTETFLRTSCIDRFSPFSLSTRERSQWENKMFCCCKSKCCSLLVCWRSKCSIIGKRKIRNKYKSTNNYNSGEREKFMGVKMFVGWTVCGTEAIPWFSIQINLHRIEWKNKAVGVNAANYAMRFYYSACRPRPR